MRINKYIASCGVCSRRAAEEYVKSGVVRINGKAVTDLAADVDERNDTVLLSGKRLNPVSRNIYIMFHKPKGCVCTTRDEKGRKTVMDYLNDFGSARLFPVGRLDYDTEGLLLLTNDGDAANRLTQPINEIPKTYIAKVEGRISENDLKKLRNGIKSDGLDLKRSKIKLLDYENGIYRFEITIFEGKNRQIHRMFEAIGGKVVFLKRIKIGDITLGGLARGSCRRLSKREIDAVLKL